MLKALFLILMPFSLMAHEADFQMRKTWVKDLKSLAQEIELTSSDKNLQVEINFFEKFNLINSAWADSRYDCFYGGWPSKLVSSGGRKLCTNPVRGNSEYSSGQCKADELQCNPVLFGENLCVGSRTQAQRNATFANCEKLFQASDASSYGHLQEITRDKANDLREFSALASEVCEKNKYSMCAKIKSRLSDGLKAITNGEIANNREVASEKKKTFRVEYVKVHHDEAECLDETHEHNALLKSVKEITKTAQNNSYEQLKKAFQASSFCDPLKVINNPNKDVSAPVLSSLQNDLRGLSQRGVGSDFLTIKLKQLVSKFKLPESVVKTFFPLLISIAHFKSEDKRRDEVAQLNAGILQSFLKHYKNHKEFKDIAQDELLKHNIFEENDEGEIECPFVSQDAFEKAMKGRDEVLKKHRGSIKNPNLLTIVDYSKPSNQRRLFVIDTSTGEVVHNTWVAHGSGGGAFGSDGLGGGPEVSNVSGSLQSSDGFIIATQASKGNLYGPNVLLKGIDKGNTNIASRQIVVHGWNSPMGQFSEGISNYDYENDRYGPVFKPDHLLKTADIKNASTRSLEKMISDLGASTSVTPVLPTTEGCLGVPVSNMKHLDKKGRDISQLEMLREDLPGSIIFNYSSPQMKSNFF